MNDLQPIRPELPPTNFRSAKLKPWHLDRVAVVYVRQSSPQQVLGHRESTSRQYGLSDRAAGLGWPAERVTTIDEDQGHSGRSMDGRPGFQRLLAEVALERVGLILALEMSRLARSCKDWHHLLELCARYRTLLGDADAVYDPTDFNDRLLLGLKGSMSEAELHVLRERMYQGMLNKASRGELFNHVPIGYIRHPETGAVLLDPDEQVQGVVRLIFDQFDAQGTLHGLLRYLVHHGLKVPVRPHYGPNRGELEWRRPNRPTLQNLLHHPIYAGAYRHGHRAIDPRRQQPGRPGTGRGNRRPEDCRVLRRDKCPAYITWERFMNNQRRLEANRQQAPGATDAPGACRNGPSLLAGLVVCGRCGRRMTVRYSGKRLRYVCDRATSDYGEPLCQSLAGRDLDDLVASRVLAAVEPAALEASLAALEGIETERRQLTVHWQQRLERARYAVDRAARQYHAIEPENRLVARELERQWENALREQRQQEEHHADFLRSQAAAPSAADIAAIRSLADDVPALWLAPTTAAAERQRLVRLLIQEIHVEVVGVSDVVRMTLTWYGGLAEEHECRRPPSTAISTRPPSQNWPIACANSPPKECAPPISPPASIVKASGRPSERRSSPAAWCIDSCDNSAAPLRLPAKAMP